MVTVNKPALHMFVITAGNDKRNKQLIDLAVRKGFVCGNQIKSEKPMVIEFFNNKYTETTIALVTDETPFNTAIATLSKFPDAYIGVDGYERRIFSIDKNGFYRLSKIGCKRHWSKYNESEDGNKVIFGGFVYKQNNGNLIITDSRYFFDKDDNLCCAYERVVRPAIPVEIIFFVKETK